MPAPTQPARPTRRHAFATIEGHTCGNPVRLVVSGHPALKGETMSDQIPNGGPSEPMADEPLCEVNRF